MDTLAITLLIISTISACILLSPMAFSEDLDKYDKFFKIGSIITIGLLLFTFSYIFLTGGYDNVPM